MAGAKGAGRDRGARRRRWPRVLAALALLLGLAFLLLRTPDTDPGAMRAKYGGPPSRFLEIAPGFSVHLRDRGPRDAPAILLLHGSNASLHTWEPWAARLAGRFRVVALDLQGHGLTGPHPSACYASACMAETVEAVRAALGLERIVIAGNSMGGRVAISYAVAHPGRVAALVLVNSAGAPPPDGAAAPGGRTPIGFRIATLPVVRDLATVVTPRWMIARSLEASVVAKEPAAGEAAIDRYWELLRYPGNRRATLERFATPTTRVSPLELKALAGVPVLILWGADDPLFPEPAARRFAAALPHARLALLPGVGHIPQEEAPDESVDALTRFLDQLQPAGRGGKAPQAAA